MIDRKTFNIVKKVKDIDRNIQDFKDTQFSGSSNIISYPIETNNTWDINFTTTVPSHFATITYQATTQFAPTASLKARILINGVENIYNDGSNFIPELEPIYDLPPGGYQQVNWRINMSGTIGRLIQIKFSVIATDVGTLTVSGVTP
jgi:hypothetical protein